MRVRPTLAIAVALTLCGTYGLARAASATTPGPHRVARPAVLAGANAAVDPNFGVTGNYTPLVGDFDGDGRSDIFWYTHAPNASKNSVWFGTANRQFTVVPEQIYGDYMPIVLDMNGDGRSDIFWYHTETGRGPLWLGNANHTFSHQTIDTPGSFFVPVAGDFNGDGHDDILWDAPGNGHDYQWLGDGHGSFTKRLIHINGDFQISVGDFNGDGRDDVFLATLRPGTNSYIGIARAGGSFAFAIATRAPAGTIAFAVDVNRDGDDDIFFYGPGAVADSIWYGGATVPRSRAATEIDGANYVPVVGDFDGDGSDDVFWYAPGLRPDQVWFDVSHDVPAPRGSQPHEQWEIGLGAQRLVSAAVDRTQAYASFDNGAVYAYSRTTGLPVWSRTISCSGGAGVRRELDILLVTCGAHVAVYRATTGAVQTQYTTHGGSACVSDSPYYWVEWLVPPGATVAHLTVLAVRTGAVVWRTPITADTPCALSGDRLMTAPPLETSPGLTEYDVATRQLVFHRTTNVVWSFGPSGYVAMCDGNEDLIGIAPSGSIAWTTQYACPGYDAPFSFGRSTIDLESGADVDIVTGRLLGASSLYPPIGSSDVGGTSDSTFWYTTAHQPRRGGCPGPGSELMFLGPYGSSPWLTAAAPLRGPRFSYRAIAVQRAAASCTPPTIEAWDQRGFIRWVMPAGVALDVGSPIGNDIATNGGIEASALLGINQSDGALELIDLP